MVVVYALTGREPTPLRSRDLPPAIAGVIERATTSTIDARFYRTDALVEALAAAVGVAKTIDHPMDVANPYKGLYPFAESDSLDFLGRGRQPERRVAEEAHVGVDAGVAVRLRIVADT